MSRRAKAATQGPAQNLDHLEGQDVQVVESGGSTEPGSEEVTDALPPLQYVERVRERVMRGQMHELMRLRVYISTLGGNQAAVDQLRGRPGDLVLARIVDLILRELGHEEALSVDDTKNVSKTRRAVNRTRG